VINGERPPGFARSAADVNPVWLTWVLRAAGVLKATESVASVASEPIGTGQMADTVRLALTYEPSGVGPPSIVGKFASADDQSRSTGLVLRAYEIEVSFYREVAPLVTVALPDLLYGVVDPRSGMFTLLLEDIVGAEQGDQIVGCDVDTAAAALDELAGLHAPCWESPRLASLEWLNRNSAQTDAFSAVLIGSMLPGFMERYADRLDPEHAALCARFTARLAEWLSLRVGPRTVVHCDFRLDNFLFRPGMLGPVVVDWQTAAWAAGSYDAAYFLGGCLLPEVRRANEHDLLAHYHGRLRGLGVKDYSFERLQADYRRDSFGGLMMAIAASMLVQRTERGDEMFLTMTARHAQHVLDLDAEAVLRGPGV
jgi:hypothetical protein